MLEPLEQPADVSKCDHCKQEFVFDGRVHECKEMYMHRNVEMMRCIKQVRALKEEIKHAPFDMKDKLTSLLLDMIETLHIGTAGPAALAMLHRYEKAENMCNAITLAEHYGTDTYKALARQAKQEWWQYVFSYDRPMHPSVPLTTVLQAMQEKTKDMQQPAALRVSILLQQLSKVSEAATKMMQAAYKAAKQLSDTYNVVEKAYEQDLISEGTHRELTKQLAEAIDTIEQA